MGNCDDTIRVCNHCNGEVREHAAGDESWSICDDCRSIEGGDREMTYDEYEKLIEGI